MVNRYKTAIATSSTALLVFITLVVLLKLMPERGLPTALPLLAPPMAGMIIILLASAVHTLYPVRPDVTLPSYQSWVRLQQSLEHSFVRASKGERLVVVMCRILPAPKRTGESVASHELLAVSNVITKECRNTSVVYDEGGTLLTFLSGYPLSTARAYASRAQREVLGLQLRDVRGMQVGIAEYHPGMASVGELLTAAQLALDEAWHHGPAIVIADA